MWIRTLAEITNLIYGICMGMFIVVLGPYLIYNRPLLYIIPVILTPFLIYKCYQRFCRRIIKKKPELSEILATTKLKDYQVEESIVINYAFEHNLFKDYYIFLFQSALCFLTPVIWNFILGANFDEAIADYYDFFSKLYTYVYKEIKDWYTGL